ncbi:MAG: LLM class F420-dependent oxidoreductase [Chloroflexi bacterium]|nr:LLM class F420-dependent oxidoreductase [Chloroflexota bacterium]
MQLGVVFPQTELGADPTVVRDYVQAVEGMGFSHLAIYDHVLGADPANRPGWRGPYTHRSLFHEPFVLFGYLAGLTQRLELVTSIIILPQRQTVLVAKQAAEVDVLARGRFRLGVGIGWNQVEYEALGEDFHTRGRRMEEQMAVLRALWTQEVVTFQGRWHHITEAGLNPLPVQRPIPIWMGGGAEPVLQRIGRLADGWFPQIRPDDNAKAALERLRSYAREAGRDPASIGIEARGNAATGTPEDWARHFAAWRDLGATHLSVNTMGGGFTSPDQHVAALRQYKETVR